MIRNKKGFTLVELLAVIVILAIILVIAVPQIIKTIDSAREGAFSASAKLIATTAEKEYLARKTIGDTSFEGLDTIPCTDVVKENTNDYQDCSISFDENGKATVTLIGAGKFAGKYVCNGNKTTAEVIEESCTSVSLTVDANGGTNTVTYKAKYEPNSTVELTVPEAPGEDYEFNGWEVSEGASVNGNILTMGTSATTVTARWKIAVAFGNAVTYLKNQLAVEEINQNGLSNPKITKGDDEYNTGIRYTGSNPNNYVWFNCESSYEKDGETINYGDAGYKYENYCELWRIIGVFDVEGTERIKIINTSSTFKASWDSSESTVNIGWGINQWGRSVYLDATTGEETTTEYEGADLMRLLNGYYIKRTSPDYVKDENDPTTLCQYNNASGKEGLEQECDTSTRPLSDYNMKPLTQSALGMISNAKWYTYATDTSTASTAYLQERGIIPTPALTGKACTAGTKYCSDQVTRENEWEGLVGLMYLSDMKYANGWLYTSGKDVSYAWSISPSSDSGGACYVWLARSSSADYFNVHYSYGVWPSVYLNSNVQIVGGNGTSEATTEGTGPYVLSA